MLANLTPDNRQRPPIFPRTDSFGRGICQKRLPKLLGAAVILQNLRADGR
jgi:hypothetical protein